MCFNEVFFRVNRTLSYHTAYYKCSHSLYSSNLIHKKYFSTKTSMPDTNNTITTPASSFLEEKDGGLEADNKIYNINPWFFTGFCDAAISFNIVVTKTPYKTGKGWRVQARFIIELNTKDLDLLKALRSYFKEIGTISIKTRANSGEIARWSVVGINGYYKSYFAAFF